MNLNLGTSLSLKHVLGFALLSTAIAAPVSASESDHEDAKHFPGIFVGVLDTDDETDTSIGLEYEYKFVPNWGAGVVYEKASDAHHGDGITSTIAAVYYHPHKGWRLGLGAGKEKVGGHHSHTEDLFRVGVAYDFHVGGFGIAPTFNVDRVDGENAHVYGIAFTKGF